MHFSQVHETFFFVVTKNYIQWEWDLNLKGHSGPHVIYAFADRFLELHVGDVSADGSFQGQASDIFADGLFEAPHIRTPRIRDSSYYCCSVTQKPGQHTIQRLTHHPTANTLSNG